MDCLSAFTCSLARSIISGGALRAFSHLSTLLSHSSKCFSSSGVTVHLRVAPAHGMSGRELIFGFLLKVPVVPPAEWREFRCCSSIRIRSLQLSMNDGEAPGFSIHFLTRSIHSSMMFFSGVIVPLDGGCSSLNAARTGSHEGLNLLQSGKCFQ
jgi:hypothetical protein